MSDLRQLVLVEVENTDETDPRTIAKAVAAQLDEAELRDAVEELLPELVTSLFRRERKAPVEAPASSSRWQSAGDVYQALLSTRLFCGGEWKLLKDCTQVDLLSAVEDRRKLAAENLAWADRYERLAKKMRSAKAATVAELPAEVVVEAVG